MYRKSQRAVDGECVSDSPKCWPLFKMKLVRCQHSSDFRGLRDQTVRFIPSLVLTESGFDSNDEPCMTTSFH